MQYYLQLDVANQARRYKKVPGKPGPNEFAIGLSKVDRGVIYGTKATDVANLIRTDNVARANIEVYNDDTYRKRRLLCDSALGLIMLDNPLFTSSALFKVNDGITKFMKAINDTPMDPDDKKKGAQKFVQKDGKYVSNATSFGRLEPQPQLSSPRDEIARWLGELKRNAASRNIARTMSLYDIFFKIYVRDMNTSNVKPSMIHKGNWRKPGKPGVPVTTTMESKRIGVRQGWYDDKDARGRDNKVPPGEVKVTDKPGLISGWLDVRTLARAGVANNGHGGYYGEKSLSERKRGIDMFAKATQAPPPSKPLAVSYFQDLADHRLNFSASASGTTSTLLASAQAFYPEIFRNKEHIRQYVMACVAYLVGGGMHTCHEVFHTAGLLGATHFFFFYIGTYINDILPITFTRDNEVYPLWRHEFIDVIEGKG